MSFLYPDVIAIWREQAASEDIGAQGYDDALPELPRQSGIPANIQISGRSRALAANLPSDTYSGTLWDIFFKKANFQVQERDIIIDQYGKRYQIAALEKHPLGYTCTCERLQS